MAGPYYVDVTTGDNGDTGLTEALAWADLGYAANQVAAGETVYVKASASYTADDPDTATTNWEITTAGTSTTPIIWIGYTSTITDGGVVTVDAQDTNTTACLCMSGAVYNVFKNFRFSQATGVGFSGASSNVATFINCRFDNNGSDGVNVASQCSFEGCLSDNNAGMGFVVTYYSLFVACIALSNTTNGFWLTSGSCFACISAKNAGDWLFACNSNYSFGMFNCVGDGDNDASQRGFEPRGDGYSIAIANCIFMDCNVGITSGNDCGELVISRNNLFYSNGTDRTSWKAGEGDVAGSSDPFTDSANDDYSLKSGSEAIDTGYDASQPVSDWGL